MSALPRGTERIKTMEQTVGTLAVRVDKLEKDNSELFYKANTTAVAQAAIGEKLSSMLVTLGEVKQAVSNIQSIPEKRLETILRAVITGLLSGLCGYLFARLS